MVDEFGGTAGLLTVEDVVEELFGEIEDEHDSIDLEEQEIDANTFIFSGRLEIDYLNLKYQLNLPESDEYETLNGLIVSFAESIPSKNEKIVIKDYNFEILEVNKTRIEKVQLFRSL